MRFNRRWGFRGAVLGVMTLVASMCIAAFGPTQAAEAWSWRQLPVLKCVVSSSPAEAIVGCLLKAGLRTLTKAIGEKILGGELQKLLSLCYEPTALGFFLNDCKVGDPPNWQSPAPPTAASDAPALFHGVPGDGNIVQSDDGNVYVAAGGRLFWFDQTNPAVRDPLLAQREQGYGDKPFPLMSAADIHANEVNRAPTGTYSPGSHMPLGGTFLREVGNPTQYLVTGGRPFAIGSPAELLALGGQDQAVVVPPSVGDLQRAPAQWGSDGGLIQFWGGGTVYTAAGNRVPSVDTRDCLQVTTGRGVTLLPGSAQSQFPVTGGVATCDFPHGQWLRADQSGRQLQVLYGAGHLVSDPNEVVRLNGQNRALPVSEQTFNNLLARGMTVPNGHLFRAPGSPAVFQTWTNQFQHVGGPAQESCLQGRNQAITEVVPQSFIDRLVKGPDAICVLPDGQFIFDSSSGQQYMGLFGGSFQVTVDQLGALGGINRATPMGHAGAQFLERQNNLFNLPDSEILRAAGDTAVYEAHGGRIQHIGNPLALECFKTRDNKAIRTVPQDLINRERAMGRISAGDASCDLENTLIIAPNNVNVGYVLGGELWPVQSPAIRDCLKRNGARVSGMGDPLPASGLLWGSYPTGPNAYCS